MFLSDEKKNIEKYYCVGFDKYSEQYLLETMDFSGNNRYFIISEEQYKWFDIEPQKLEELVDTYVEKKYKCEMFYFSTWEKENTYEQNKLMWRYTYIDMLVNKDREEIHKKIGKPDIIEKMERVEIFKMSCKMEIQVEYENEICINVIVKWRE